MNWRIAGFTAAVSLLTGVLFGLIPALQSLTPDLIPALKDDGTYRRDSTGFKLSRRVLIVMQIALSVVVLICAGLFVRSLGKIYSIDPGFRIDNVLIAELQLPMNRYNEEKTENFYQQLVDRLKGLPGDRSVAMSAYTPLCGSYLIQTIVPEGQDIKPSEMPMTDANNVGAGYHEMMGIPMLQGRGFTPEDRKGTPLVAVVNEAFARRFFPDGNAYGKRIRLGVGKPLIEIVGVMRNIKTMSLQSEDRPQLDLPIAQQGMNNPMRVMLRTRDDAASMLPTLRRAVRAMDPGLAFFKTTTLENDLRATISLDRMIASLLSLFGGIALLLAAVGLYGIIAYAVEHRTREIGIRMALGAQPRDILRLTMREGFLLLSLGLVAGIGTAAGSMRLIESHLYNVRPIDPLTFIAVTVILAFVALLACWIPARMATRVDPMIALRNE
jgi:predicted permease